MLCIPRPALPSMDAYIEKKTIGRGAFAIVRLVERKSTGEFRVVKKFHTSMGELSDKERTEIAQEVKLLAVLRHPNVIGYFDNFVDVSLINLSSPRLLVLGSAPAYFPGLRCLATFLVAVRRME